MVRRIEAGEIRGLVSIGFDARGDRRVARALDKLDFYLAIDSVLSDAARRADIVLPAGGPSAAGDAGERDDPVD